MQIDGGVGSLVFASERVDHLFDRVLSIGWVDRLGWIKHISTWVTSAGAGYDAAHIIELNEDVLLPLRQRIQGVEFCSGEFHPAGVSCMAARARIDRDRIAISLVRLPNVQQTIVVIVLNRGANNHRSPGYAPLLATAWCDHGCCRIVVFLHSSPGESRIGEGPCRVVPRAVPAGECRLAASIQRGSKCLVGKVNGLELVALTAAHNVRQSGYRGTLHR